MALNQDVRYTFFRYQLLLRPLMKKRKFFGAATGLICPPGPDMPIFRSNMYANMQIVVASFFA